MTRLTTSHLTITPATQSELKAAHAVMSEAIKWLADLNTPLWIEEDIAQLKLQSHIEKNELFVAKVAGEIAGTIIIIDDDKPFWPEITDGSSLYFHKLVVARKFAGQGLAAALIEFAVQKTRNVNRTHLRMDCSANHPRLRRFYESCGFIFVDQQQVGRFFVDRLYRKV